MVAYRLSPPPSGCRGPAADGCAPAGHTLEHLPPPAAEHAAACHPSCAHGAAYDALPTHQGVVLADLPSLRERFVACSPWFLGRADCQPVAAFDASSRRQRVDVRDAAVCDVPCCAQTPTVRRARALSRNERDLRVGASLPYPPRHTAPAFEKHIARRHLTRSRRCVCVGAAANSRFQQDTAAAQAHEDELAQVTHLRFIRWLRARLAQASRLTSAPRPHFAGATGDLADEHGRAAASALWLGVEATRRRLEGAILRAAAHARGSARATGAVWQCAAAGAVWRRAATSHGRRAVGALRLGARADQLHQERREAHVRRVPAAGGAGEAHGGARWQVKLRARVLVSHAQCVRQAGLSRQRV